MFEQLLSITKSMPWEWSPEAIGWALQAYLIMQIIALAKTDGLWRFFAFLPLLFALYAVIIVVFNVSKGSNLAPIMLIFFGPPAFLYFVVYFLIMGLCKFFDHMLPAMKDKKIQRRRP